VAKDLNVDDVKTQPVTGQLPRLAFVYHPASFAAMAIVDAAHERCELIWLVDSGDPRLGPMPRLLARLGTVIDVAGMAPAEAASVVAAHDVDGVLALADEFLVWTASLADALGLPFLSPDAARQLTDKYAQRSALRAAGLAAPGSWAVTTTTTDADWLRLASETTLPAVLKPRYGASSRNTFFVTSADQARAIVAESTHAAGLTDKDWVLEEYIADVDHAVCGEGFANYLSVESAVVAGRATHLAITGRMPPAKPFRETGEFIPAAVDVALASELGESAGRAIRALGADVGCFHTEIKLTPSGPVVIEVNGRVGGGIPELLALTTGIDFLGMAMHIALGGNADLDLLTFRGVGYQLQVQPPEDMHRITAIAGLEDVMALPGVREVKLNRGPGDDVDWRDGTVGYAFSVLGATDDYDGLRGIVGQLAELVRIDGV
jgi:biotin carboxylase